MATGFIRLNRSYFEHPFWKENRKFSPAEAWLYLIKNARFDIKPEIKLTKMKTLIIKRGEIHASIRYLSTAWSWGNGKTSRFIKMLEFQNMVERRTVQGETILTLLNFNDFNPIEKSERNSSEYTNGTPYIQDFVDFLKKQTSNEYGNGTDNDTLNKQASIYLQQLAEQPRNAIRNSSEYTSGTVAEHLQVQTKESKEGSKKEKNFLFREKYFSILEIFFFKNYKHPINVTNNFYRHYEATNWKNGSSVTIESIESVAGNWKNKLTEGNNCPPAFLQKWEIIYNNLKQLNLTTGGVKIHKHLLAVRPALLINGILTLRGKKIVLNEIANNAAFRELFLTQIKAVYGAREFKVEPDQREEEQSLIGQAERKQPEPCKN